MAPTRQYTIMGGINSVSKTKLDRLQPMQLTRGELLEKGLQEIFSYYCRQTLEWGASPTFEKIQKQYSQMGVSAYLQFCNDFGILRQEKKRLRKKNDHRDGRNMRIEERRKRLEKKWGFSFQKVKPEFQRKRSRSKSGSFRSSKQSLLSRKRRRDKTKNKNSMLLIKRLRKRGGQGS